MAIHREHIGFFGKMNSGKSSLMNLITQQETSITDSTPGTTADTKVAFSEIHGLGPVKLFDTAGLDEVSDLGEKKRSKVLNVMKESDLLIVVIDPSSLSFETEQQIIEYARENDKQILVVFNLFNVSSSKLISDIHKKLPYLKFYPAIELIAVDLAYRKSFLEFIITNYQPKKQENSLLPFVRPDEFYILNIPMDEETPEGRFLRPQAMAVEYITRNWAYAATYRMNLSKARSVESEIEKERFLNFIHSFRQKPRAIITDSQAMDIMIRWVPRDIDLTTFSIMMINHVSNGKAADFHRGVEVMHNIKEGDKILIAEACNHSRIQEDIGTVQIPKIINDKFPGVQIDFNFGREFQDNALLQNYKLIIHCGGCMISNQKLQARLRDLQQLGVAVTNYGIFLSWAQGENALQRVMKPWG